MDRVFFRHGAPPNEVFAEASGVNSQVVKPIHRMEHFYYPRFWASKTAKWLWRVQKFAVFFTLFEHI